MKKGEKVMDEIENFINNIKENGIIRKLDELGRIVIPREFRSGKVREGITNIVVFNIKDYVIVEIKEQSENVTKKIDELGRVLINMEIRNALEWREKDLIEIWSFNNYYILKKVEESCIFCGTKKQLAEFKTRAICKKCAEEIANKVCIE